MAKYERFIIVSDTHGDEQNPSAVAWALDFCKHFKPQHRIHLGDAFDFRWLRKKASEEEKREKVREDFDAGCNFIRDLKPTIFLMGNHDWRLFKGTLSDHGTSAELCSRMVEQFSELLGAVKPVKYNKREGVVRFGDLTLLHGYQAGINAVRDTAMVYGNWLWRKRLR